MDNALVRLKLKQRLNKLASSDYTGLECWQEAELINKAQLQWTRRQLHGGNQYREGDEQSISRIDDFQFLLTPRELKGSNHGVYFETELLPSNYMKYKRVAVMAISEDCPHPKRINVSLIEEANVDRFLGDYLLRPSFQWEETFATLIGNKVRVYTNNNFIVKELILTYYRLPKDIVFEGCRDWNDIAGSEQKLEFGESAINVILDEAVQIAASDLNDFNNAARSEKAEEENN